MFSEPAEVVERKKEKFLRFMKRFPWTTYTGYKKTFEANGLSKVAQVQEQLRTVTEILAIALQTIGCAAGSGNSIHLFRHNDLSRGQGHQRR